MKKVLIIDDTPAARATIREMLERGGYDVVDARNGNEGLRMIEEHTPDLVVTDIIMPDMEGIEIIRILRKTKSLLPIIAITGSIETPYLQMAQKFGAVCGLYKPFRQAELLYAVENALQAT